MPIWLTTILFAGVAANALWQVWEGFAHQRVWQPNRFVTRAEDPGRYWATFGAYLALLVLIAWWTAQALLNHLAAK